MKKLLCALCGLLWTGTIFAENVSQERAAQWAKQFIQKMPGSRAGNVSLKMVWNGQDQAAREAEAPAFFVFNRTDQQGFVVVSGDDLVQPLVGYSMKEMFETEHMPDNIRLWLMDRKQEINFIRKHPEWAPKETKTQWTRTESAMGEVKKQIKTAKWNQADPYNMFCPKEGTQNTMTGCTATAFAIAMRARQWPDAGVGTMPEYKYKRGGAEVTVPAHELGYNYAWDKMPLEMHALSNEESKKAVATLMRDCGLMCRSQFGKEETGAFPQDGVKGLIEFMKYSPATTFEERQFYATEQWHSMLQQELEQRGPVVYCGYSTTTGHSFVLDGYTTANYYSVNWGWGGMCNGFYVLSMLKPDQQGIGGSVVDEPFYYYQGAVLGMKKAEANEVNSNYPNLFMVSLFYDVTPDEKDQFLLGLLPQTRTIKQHVPFVISHVCLLNQSTSTVSPELMLSVFDAEGKWKSAALEEPITVDGFEAGFLLVHSNIDACIKQPIAANDYLALAYRPKGAKDWKEVRGGQKSQFRIPLDSDDFAVEGDDIVLTGGLNYDDVFWGLHSKDKQIAKGKAFVVNTGEIGNASVKPFDGVVSVAQYNIHGTFKALASERTLKTSAPLQPSQTFKADNFPCVITEEIEEGDYLALCYAAKEGQEWKQIRPLTGVVGRISLQVGNTPDIHLDKQTSLTFNRTEKIITLTSEVGGSYELKSADGVVVSEGNADTKGVMKLEMVGMEKGNYTLTLKKDEYSYTLKLVW